MEDRARRREIRDSRFEIRDSRERREERARRRLPRANETRRCPPTASCGCATRESADAPLVGRRLGSCAGDADLCNKGRFHRRSCTWPWLTDFFRARGSVSAGTVWSNWKKRRRHARRRRERPAPPAATAVARPMPVKDRGFPSQGNCTHYYVKLPSLSLS